MESRGATRKYLLGQAPSGNSQYGAVCVVNSRLGITLRIDYFNTVAKLIAAGIEVFSRNVAVTVVRVAAVAAIRIEAGSAAGAIGIEGVVT